MLGHCHIDAAAVDCRAGIVGKAHPDPLDIEHTAQWDDAGVYRHCKAGHHRVAAVSGGIATTDMRILLSTVGKHFKLALILGGKGQVWLLGGQHHRGTDLHRLVHHLMLYQRLLGGGHAAQQSDICGRHRQQCRCKKAPKAHCVSSSHW